jgi:phosphoglycerate dehydrogenase-like enzyme
MADLILKKILLITRIPGLEEELIARLPSGLDITRSKDAATTAKLIPQADFILGDPVLVAPYLDTAAKLSWFQSTFAGVEIVFRASKRRNYTLTRIQDVFGALMCEYVFAHLLSRERNLPVLRQQQVAQSWEVERYRRMFDLTLGIMGVGNIGQVVASMAKAFGLNVWGLRSTNIPVENVDRIFTSENLDEFLAGCDYIVNVLPSTPKTRDLLSGATLKAADGAVFINIGRGDVIDEDSIISALDKGWLSEAILDVFPIEPLPGESPLWTTSGVVITPHVAALSFATDIARIFHENYVRLSSGKELIYQVNWKKGY